MRVWKELAGACAAFGIAIVLTPPAEAQSFFQKLFGFAGPAQPLPSVRQVIPPQRFQSHGTYRPRTELAQPDDEEIGPPDSGGPYKTVCVRTCDGFYFPIRSGAKRKNFASDVKSCRNACGSDARLYYYSLNGPEGPDAMVDLGGKKYMDMPHALAYRKSLVSGCTCKAVPWSSEEAARHKGYADQEAIELAKDEAFLKARADAAVATKTEVGGEASLQSTDSSDRSPAEITQSPVAAASEETGAQDASAPMSIVEAKTVSTKVARAARRHARVSYYRVRYRPTSSISVFGNGKAKYVWPSTRH